MQRALFVGLGALASYALFGAQTVFGMIAMIVNLLTPLPATYIGLRFGVMWGWLTILLTGVLIIFAAGVEPLFLFVLQFGLPAGVLTWLLIKKVSWDRAVFVTLGIVIVASLVGLLTVSTIKQVQPLHLVGTLIDNEVSQASATMQSIFADADLPSSELESINQALNRMTEFMRDVYAGLAITVGLFMLLGLILVLSLIGRERISIPGPRFTKWKAPEPLIWVLIIAGFLVLFLNGPVKLFAMNLLVILLPIYFLQGLAVVDNFFQRKALSPILRTAGYLLVVLVNPLPLLVTCIGLFDLWVDFRKPRTPKSS